MFSRKGFSRPLPPNEIMVLKRKYPEKLIDNEMGNIRFFPANLQNKKREKGVPFVVTYHPILNSLSKIIRDNMYLLNMNEEVRKTFSPGPMVSFRSARKLSSYLVRAKLYPLERKVGSSKCGKRRCEVCNNVTDASTFSSTVTGDTFKINHSLNCDDKCLIYLITCKQCNKQYTGETKFSFIIDGLTIKTMLENLTGKSLVCRNTYINIFRWRVTKAS